MKTLPTIIGLLLVLFFSCSPQQEKTKVFFVNSYHQGYGSSDAVMEGLFSTLPGDSFKIAKYYMDTKRNSSMEYIQETVDRAVDSIRSFKPGILVACDDNAVKYLVVPHFKNKELPVVFCGVNWSAQKYGLPAENITGMLEVLPLRKLLTSMKEAYPDASNLLVLTENSTSAWNNKKLLDTLFHNTGFQKVEYELVDSFSTWKKKFKKANQEHDLVYLPTNGSIKNWDQDAAVDHVRDNIKVPVVTCDDFMMPYAVFGLTKVAREQGEWAAKTVMEISNGKRPANIPLARNQQSEKWINKALADSIALQDKEKFLSGAKFMNN